LKECGKLGSRPEPELLPRRRNMARHGGFRDAQRVRDAFCRLRETQKFSDLPFSIGQPTRIGMLRIVLDREDEALAIGIELVDE
jgi:hypothetical protein